MLRCVSAHLAVTPLRRTPVSEGRPLSRSKPVVRSTSLKLPSAISAQFGVSLSAVRKAMSNGRLPYTVAHGANSIVQLIDPSDAAKLWKEVHGDRD